MIAMNALCRIPSLGARYALAMLSLYPLADTLIIAMQSDFQSFMSMIAQSETDNALIDEINDPVTGGGFDCRVKFIPSLAESWDHPADSRSVLLPQDVYLQGLRHPAGQRQAADADGLRSGDRRQLVLQPGWPSRQPRSPELPGLIPGSFDSRPPIASFDSRSQRCALEPRLRIYGSFRITR